jgi:CRP-like cAMP-binding protein
LLHWAKDTTIGDWRQLNQWLRRIGAHIAPADGRGGEYPARGVALRDGAIGKYRLLHELGSGATSIVYLAHDEFQARDVALKVIDAEQLGSEGMMLFQRMFMAEACLVGKLRHPHVVELLDAGIDDHGCYIVMEYVEGGTLEQFCAPDRLLPHHQAADIVYKCCKALGFAQRNGLVHRDIKPANILIGKDGRVKVTDFGAAVNKKLIDITHISGLGSAAYMSPQQLAGHPLTHQADIYSLGVVLYKLLTGTLPFKAGSLSELAEQIKEADVPPPSVARPGVPPRLDAIVKRATARDLEARYRSWDKFAEDLANVSAKQAARAPVLAEKDKLPTLRALAALKGFSDADLTAMLPGTAWRQFPRNARIFAAGDQGHSFYVLAQGGLSVRREGREVGHVGAGELFGESAYLTRGRVRRGEDAVATQDTVVVEFNPDLLWVLLPAAERRFEALLQESLARRLSDANARLARVLSELPAQETEI